MKEYNCDNCLEGFNFPFDLENHKNTDKQCQKFRNIEFSCNICGFRTIGIKNLEKHIIECSNKDFIYEDDNLNYQLLRIEDKIDKLIKLQNAIEENRMKSSKKIKKNKIIDDFDNNEYTIEDDENVPLKIRKFSPDNVKSPLFKRTPDKNTGKISQKNSPVTPVKRKPQYKSFKNNLDLNPELSKDQKFEQINSIKEKIQELKNDLINIENYKKNLDTYIDNIKQNRNYTKFLELIKTKRTDMIDSMDYNDYYDLLVKNVKNLEIIFRKKEYNEKKIITTISKSMNSIDLRILNYGSYFTTELDIDEMQKLKKSLTIFNGSDPDYKPFIFDEFMRKFYNYGSILFTIKENLERNLFNTYGFNNVVYIPLKNSTLNDPWSFYTLESMSKEKRYWKMDCRLEDLSLNFFNNMKSYLVNIFRKIYSDIYHDNHYRKDYNNSNITELDCEQLLQNIYILLNPKDFCNFLRQLVVEKATYIPTENDKGDFLSDDRIQKKRFSDNNEKYDVFDLIRLLFDDISSEEAIDFYRKD